MAIYVAPLTAAKKANLPYAAANLCLCSAFLQKNVVLAGLHKTLPMKAALW
ncbi:hypothetical protein LJC55_00980 [Eubacteriales bacterium OttesenSCG-928-N14]|nr:hypothetical protein [Eubacteriales bacterium OttesenSCG-928-N14]